MKSFFTIAVSLLGWLVVFPCSSEVPTPACESPAYWLKQIDPFIFPSNTQFRQLHPVLIPEPEDIRNANSQHGFYIEGIDALGKELHRRSPKHRNLTTCVIYPCIGYDAGFPARLFPNAHTLIGLDISPFAPSLDTHELSYYPVIGQPWVHAGDIDRLRWVGSHLIGNLQASVPNFRIRAILLAKTEPKSPSLMHRVAFEMALWLKTEPTYLNLYLGGGLHGVIYFDQGPGTPLRKYIHINTFLFSFMDLDMWWLQSISHMNPQGVIMKGGNYLFVSEKPLTRHLLKLLKMTRGVLIEGFQQNLPGAPESGLTTIPNTKHYTIPGIPAGYENKVRISIFQ